MVFYDYSPTDIVIEVFNERHRHNPFKFAPFDERRNAVPLLFSDQTSLIFWHHKLAGDTIGRWGL